MVVEYQSLYNEYWQRPDRFGSVSFNDAGALARRIVATLGAGSYLDVGCGMGDLVQALLLRGMDAHGIDVSEVAVAEGSRRAPGRFVQGSILNLPYDNKSFDNIISTDCLEHIAPEDIELALSELRRVARNGVFLIIATRKDRDNYWHLTVKDQDFWEQEAIKIGLRRHPGYFGCVDYASLNHDLGNVTLILEPVPERCREEWPLTRLALERDLHMDMSREAGSRSDAHLIRYHHAAALVRPGDTVLDAACGFGYGSWLIATRTQAERVVGLDFDSGAVAYARSAFSSPKLVFAQATLPGELSQYEDHSLDLVVCFETLEHVAEPAALLAQFARLLKPCGRVIVSVPHNWSDESGRDPNPHHMDVYDWPKLKALLSDAFLVDRAAAQTADRAKVDGAWTRQRRGWRSFDPKRDAPPCPAEWLIAVGMTRFVGLDLPDWTPWPTVAGQGSAIAPVDFTRMLDNPWLSRGLLDRGQRIQETEALARLCGELARGSGRQDAAAALTVLGYTYLGAAAHPAEQMPVALDAIEAWLRAEPESGAPQDLRWRISLTFVAARLCQKIGDLPQAEMWLERCLDHDPAIFGPMLFTKTVEAAHRLGWLRRARGDHARAAAAWRRGMAEAVRGLGMDMSAAFGEFGLRYDFAFDEIAQFCEMANLCAIALERLETDPANAERQSEMLGRPRERIETLQGQLREARAQLQRAPGPELETHKSWALQTLIRPNKWCRAPGSPNAALALHPTKLGRCEQPEAVMALTFSKAARHAVFIAEAANSSAANKGSVLLYGGANVLDASLQSIELPPKQPVAIVLPVSELLLDHKGMIRFIVCPSDTAKGISYTETLIRFVGTS